MFVLIGRLLWDKGVGEYVEAARRLRERYPHARFQLLGPVGVDNPSAITRARSGGLGTGRHHRLSRRGARRAAAHRRCGLRRPAVVSRRRAAHADGSVGDGPADRRDRRAGLPRSGRATASTACCAKCAARTASPATLARMLDMSGAERARHGGTRPRRKSRSEFDERVVVETYKDLVHNNDRRFTLTEQQHGPRRARFW